MSKYYECPRCGQSVQGFEASCRLECEGGIDHVWVEIPGPYEEEINTLQRPEKYEVQHSKPPNIDKRFYFDQENDRLIDEVTQNGIVYRRYFRRTK